MKSDTTPHFWRCYAQLPQDVKTQTQKAYELFMVDPYHPSLHFKSIRRLQSVYSARISGSYRVIGDRGGDEITWFWIGSHSEYTALIKRMRKN